MQDILIIPTFDRPELLWLCLEHISKSPDAQSVAVRVYVDAHLGQLPPKQDIETVLAKFTHLYLQVCYRYPHEFHGNSFNLMMAYKEAYDSQAKYVFMVEDDVLVQPNFFAWHREQQARQPGCSVGVVREPQHGPYASLGVCFQREMLRWLIPHCQPAYFKNMRLYCRSMFPPSKADCEQDGLWVRVLDQPKVINGRKVTWATTPVAQHVGWYGYHRKNSTRPQGTLDERYRQIKLVLGNAFILQAWSKDFGDVRPVRSL